MSDMKSADWERLTFEEKLAEARASFEYHLEGFRYDLTEQIAVALQHSEMSKTEFAEKLGVSKGRITQLLDGSNNFTLETLAKISETLDTELRLTLRPRGWEQVREFTKPFRTRDQHEGRFREPLKMNVLKGAASDLTESRLTKDRDNAFPIAA